MDNECKGTTFFHSAKGFRRKNKAAFNPPIGIFYRPNWHSRTQNTGKKANCQQSPLFPCLFHQNILCIVSHELHERKGELQGRKRRFPSRKTMSYDQELNSYIERKHNLHPTNRPQSLVHKTPNNKTYSTIPQ